MMQTPECRTRKMHHAPYLPAHSSRGHIMGMAAPGYYSAEMVRALPDDGNRYETVHGELLVTPSPRAWHQEVLARIQYALTSFLREHSAGHIFASPADISWGPEILVQPDLFVVDAAEALTFDWSKMQTLLLTIEVLSPSTARYDRFTKRRLYQEFNVPLYWIVDPDEHFFEVWTPDAKFPQLERELVVWKPKNVSQAFRLDLKKLFEPTRDSDSIDA